ncbi:unnamed protein product [Mesocestoides corti]|uniref:Large ribosomal subunit protein uL4m n=1 Tax=Mesocestoides corti TaxID=53468 RepID=A0A0R3U855_MESCO|nr:unnamed protein product [Mesocestoides corti]
MHLTLEPILNSGRLGKLIVRFSPSRYLGQIFGRRRGDRSSELAEFERTSRQLVKETASEAPLLLNPRTVAPSVTCSDRRVAPRQVWVESLRDAENQYVDIVDLHPDVFATFPRFDLVHKNLYWQAHYRIVDWRCITTRAELLHRSRRKPWPQKGTGRARHGNRRTHIFVGGGQCNGPRGPQSFFSILPYSVRVNGLLSMLTAKQAQGDLHVVTDFSLSEDLESAASEVYEMANKRAMDRLRLWAAENKGEEADADPIVQRLQLSSVEGDDTSALSSAFVRGKEDTEEMLDLIGGGQAAQAAKIGLQAAEYLRRLVDTRRWGPAVLFVTDAETYLDKCHSSNGLAMALACASYAHYIDTEVAPEAAAIQGRLREGSQYAAPRALHPGRGLTLMPVHGLNVWSMAHHDSLVMTRRALDLIEERLLCAQRRVAAMADVHSHATPPLAHDWLVARNHGEDGCHLPNRHFPGGLGDVDFLRQRLQ